MPSWTIDRVESPVVVYRRVEVGYRCDATFSTELKTRLSQANKLNVAVEYNIFSALADREAMSKRTLPVPLIVT